MKFYIATKLENHAAHNELMNTLVNHGCTCTYDWTTHGPVFKEGLERIRHVAEKEYQGVMDADVVIVLWPGGRGTHVELGMAIAAGKQCHIVTDVDGHHEASAESCAFYHHPAVRLHRTVEEMLPTIFREHYERGRLLLLRKAQAARAEAIRRSCHPSG